MNLSGNNLSTGEMAKVVYEVMLGSRLDSNWHRGPRSGISGYLDLRDQAEAIPSIGHLASGIATITGRHWRVLT